MKNLSILQKLILATLPIVFTSIFVSIFIYKSNSTESIESGKSKTNEMIRIVGQQELETVKMSEAMLAYVSDPKDESKYQAKKAADESYGKLAEELNQYIKDSPEVLVQNKKMAEFDESTLDRLENEFLELVKSGSADSKSFYKEKYLPARTQQNENFKTLKSMVYAKAHTIDVEEKHQQSRMANLTILFLWVGILICLTVVVITSTKVIRQIASVANHLKSTSDEVAGAADDIADISKKLSEATTEQAASLQETSAAIEQTSSMVVKNTENAKNAAVSTAESQENAIQGQAVVQKMIQSMEQINTSNQNIMNQINESNSRISEIVTVIQEIGTKTKVINDIVFQTKLLSFNASVEAARAGEQGKGFAVVAEEVGNLAAMSGNAAKEITTLLDGSIQKVESIVNETKQKVESLIYDGEKKVQEGTSVASECGEMLNQIVEKIQSVARMAGEISNASEEQAQGVHEITKSVSQLDQVTQQNASTSHVAAQSAETLQSQAESLNSGIQNLLQVIQGKAS